MKLCELPIVHLPKTHQRRQGKVCEGKYVSPKKKK